MTTNGTDYAENSFSDADLNSRRSQIHIKGRYNFETREESIEIKKNSIFTECFKSGADARTQIAMLTAIQGNISVVPETFKLVNEVITSLPKINTILNTRLTEFLKQKTIPEEEFDEINRRRWREYDKQKVLEQDKLWRETGAQGYYKQDVVVDAEEQVRLDQKKFVNMVHRTGTFPIDSDQTMLLLAACALEATKYHSLEHTYGCLEAVFIHNNRRYDTAAQRQHKYHEGKLLELGRFHDTTVRACKRFENRDCSWMDVVVESDKESDSDDELESDSDDKFEEITGSSDLEPWDLVEFDKSLHGDFCTDDVTGDDKSTADQCPHELAINNQWFKKISADRVMLWGIFHRFLILADACLLILDKNPMDIVKELHQTRPLYSIPRDDYVSTLRKHSISPVAPLQAIINEYHLHGACDPQRKELCRKEYHQCFARKGDMKFNATWIESEFQKEILDVSKVSHNT